jgi:hypothetical protein
MEDLRLAGMQVSLTQFYTFPAYVAIAGGSPSEPVERRLSWLAGEWIVGIVVHGTTSEAREFSPQDAGAHLLYIAVQQGLPSPPGGVEPPGSTGGTPTAAPTPEDCGLAFEDVPATHWAAGFIAQLACDGIVSGYSDGTFRPQNPTTRAQLAKMLAVSEGWELVSPAIATFPDVPPSHIFFRYIETAVRENVVSGYADGLFRPDGYVTRAQVAKMLVKAKGWPLETESPAVLCDVTPAHWAWRYVQTAIANGGFRGYADGCFYPDAVATRAQLAKVLVQASP